MKLRTNGALQDAVEAFKAGRGELMRVAREAQVGLGRAGRKSGKRKLEDTDIEEEQAAKTPIRKTRSQSKREGSGMGSVITEAVVVEDEDDKDEDFQPGKRRGSAQLHHSQLISVDDGSVPCPLCQQRMDVRRVDPHIEAGCPPENPREKPQHSSPFPSNPANNRSFRRTPSSSIPHTELQSSQARPRSRDRLPAINYSLYNDAKLRKKLQELGIYAAGPKPLLMRRHTEWMNLWNASCDSLNPKSKRELLRELDIWEQYQGSGASNVGSNTVGKKEFDRQGHSTKHSDHFNDLIAQAREKAAQKKAEAEENAQKGEDTISRSQSGERKTDDTAAALPPLTETLPERQDMVDEDEFDGAFTDSELYSTPGEQNGVHEPPATDIDKTNGLRTQNVHPTQSFADISQRPQIRSKRPMFSDLDGPKHDQVQVESPQTHVA